ncbi:MAG: hypothetical protein RR603_05230 [Kurthia sp.]|uniref:Uncharacterized protein n=1 Tax=Kurthia zopfii TaxID=1650 RepID=A0A8B4Q9Z5_9BACL|nr:hypothetical protein [Kurthia zopfii]TDR35186.1 hypothetical protein DFR61_13237 [Kurthia zopfii]GEK31364.1 hypothetical protein KZO01_16730 [Kurthia zopfii]STX09540.1 Uncharacterised protein [Kurthia zopfii]VEI06677.1 Uncharacterised protein [Kurthia zopfii]
MKKQKHKIDPSEETTISYDTVLDEVIDPKNEDENAEAEYEGVDPETIDDQPPY